MTSDLSDGNCAHEPQNFKGFGTPPVIYVIKFGEDEREAYVFACSKCGLVYWEWEEADA